MKGLLKIVMLVAVITGAIWAFARFALGIGAGGRHTEVETVDLASKLRATIDEMAGQVTEAWDDAPYENARVELNRYAPDLTGSEIDELNDRIATKFFASVKSCIDGAYIPDMRESTIAGNRRLLEAYAGLDRIAADYPLIANSEGFATLQERKKLHDEIYAFAQRDFVQGAKLRPSVEWHGSHPDLSYNNLLDYTAYANSQQNYRKELLAKFESYPEMQHAAWIITNLEEVIVKGKLILGKTKYYQAETSALQNFLRTLPESVCKAPATRGSLRDLTATLGSMSDDVRALPDRQAVNNAFNTCRNRIAELSRSLPD